MISSVKTEKFEMRYLTFGEGDKPFVIIPGISFESVLNSYNSIVKAYSDFAKEYKVYLFDRKLDIEKGYTVSDMANDTALSMIKLGLYDSYLFGVSQGGMISQCIAIRYPQLVKKLVLGSTSSRLNVETAKALNVWRDLAKKVEVRELTKNFFSKVYSNETMSKIADLFLSITNDGKEKDCERFIKILDACSGFDVYEDLPKIKCPVLVIGAKKDRVIPVEESYSIAEKIKADLYVYEDYGHAVYDEAPDYKKRIMDFFKLA